MTNLFIPNTGSTGVLTTKSTSSGTIITDTASLQALGNSAIGRSGTILGVTPSNTNKLRTLLHLSGSGLSRGRIWFLGSSVEAGAGSTSSGLYSANGKAKSRPMFVSKYLNILNTNTRSDYTCADSGAATTAGWLAFDSRVSTSGGGVYAGTSTIGGNYIGLTPGQTLTFTPGGTFDYVELGYAVTTGAAAQFGIGVDGGTTQLATITSSAGTSAFNYLSQQVTTGSTAVTIKNTGSGTNVYISVIGTRTSGSPGIEIINAGFGGSLITGTSANSWNVNASGQNWGAIGAVNAIDTSIPNVFSLEAIINDVNTGATQANYIAGQTSFIQRCQAKGEVYWRIPATPAQSSAEAASYVDRATFNAFADAARDNALSLGCVVIDERVLYPDWATTNALGLFRDGFHGNAGLYNASAQMFISLCRGLV